MDPHHKWPWVVREIGRTGRGIAIVLVAGVLGGLCLVVAGTASDGLPWIVVGMLLIAVSFLGLISFSYRAERAEGAGVVKSAWKSCWRAIEFAFDMLP